MLMDLVDGRISRRIPNRPLPTWGSHWGWSTVWKCFQPLLILSIPLITLNFTPIHVYPRLKSWLKIEIADFNFSLKFNNKASRIACLFKGSELSFEEVNFDFFSSVSE